MEIALLTPQEERVASKTDLVLRNQRLVYYFANRYESRGVALEDLVQEGNLGLIRAARTFDPERHVKFITYATWWVRRYMQVAVRKARQVPDPHRWDGLRAAGNIIEDTPDRNHPLPPEGLREALDEAISTLPRHLRRTVQALFFAKKDTTFAAIGRRLRRSRESARQYAIEAMDTLAQHPALQEWRTP